MKREIVKRVSEAGKFLVTGVCSDQNYLRRDGCRGGWRCKGNGFVRFPSAKPERRRHQRVA